MKKSPSLMLILFLTVNWIIPVAAQSLDQTENQKFEKLDIPRRLVAIDRVCAWPNLSVLKDGTIIATIYNQPNHGLYEGDAECWASEDGGLTWRYRGTPTQHEPFTNRMNVAAGVNAENELVVLCGGWDNIRPRRNSKSSPLEASISLSKDGGQTWERAGTMPPAVKGLSHHVPFGDIMVAANGDLLVGTYAFDVHPDESIPDYKREGHIYAVRSSDGGKTWDKVIPVVKDIHVEAAMLHLGEGKWLAASRRFGYLDLDLHVSTDDGFSWKQVENHGLTIPQVSSAHLLELNDGRILLTYGNRSPGNGGIDARISEDQGKSWSAPHRITNLSGKDLGYPAAVQLPDGRIMVAYYSGGIQQHDRYHMGVVNFLLEEVKVKLPE